MNIKKLMPIVIGFLLIVIAILLFLYSNKKEKGYNEFSLTYNGNKSIMEIKTGTSVIINNTKIEIISTEGNKVVVRTDDYLMSNQKESNEFEVTLNKKTDICYKENDCIVLNLK